jgi:hypothetical protein
VTATGPNPNIGAHSLEGNIAAYWPDNPNTTGLTGIPNPRMRDPYVMSWFIGIQREIRRDLVIDVNYVGTAGRKLLRAEDWNRFTGDWAGAQSPTGEYAGDTSLNRMNQTYGALRFCDFILQRPAGAGVEALLEGVGLNWQLHLGQEHRPEVHVALWWHDQQPRPGGLLHGCLKNLSGSGTLHL